MDKILNDFGHKYCKNWAFESNEEKELANKLAKVAEMNEIAIDEFTYIFTHVLRLLKHQSAWSRL